MVQWYGAIRFHHKKESIDSSIHRSSKRSKPVEDAKERKMTCFLGPESVSTAHFRSAVSVSPPVTNSVTLTPLLDQSLIDP